MKYRVLALALFLLGACGSEPSEDVASRSETFEQRSTHLAEALCTHGQRCANQSDYDHCYQDVIHDMEDAKAKLSTEGQTACMSCMAAKVDELEKRIDSMCKEPLDEQRVLAACGASGDEACAGYP